MVEFVEQFKEKLLSEISKDSIKLNDKELNNAIALGVLLWVVAETDKKFLPEEKDKIKEALNSHARISKEHIPAVIATVEQAAEERIDIWSFTHLFRNLPSDDKIPIIENLFRVACADKDLAFDETEMIRKMAKLMDITHTHFIDAKIKVKKELGLDTV